MPTIMPAVTSPSARPQVTPSPSPPSLSPSPSPSPAPSVSADERVRRQGLLRQLLGRPEFGSIAGALLVIGLFYAFAGHSGMFSMEGIINWGTVAGYLGVIAVGAALLMIAGEFDLSVGSMIGFAGILFVVPVLYWGWSPWLALPFTFAVTMSLGWLNGWLVIRTGLPSFIVTLAFFFILRGLSLAVSVLITGKTILSANGPIILSQSLAQDALYSWLFRGYVLVGSFDWLASQGWITASESGRSLAIGVPKVLVWWLVLALSGAYVLAQTRFGNWILATGGDVKAAQYVGIPTARVKLTLFVFMAFCSTLFAVLQVGDAGSAAADRGLQKEFEAIIAAVIGGCLLTGGYGSVVGASLGALIFGIVQIGIGYTSIDNNWYRVFLGLMLLVAVLFNRFIHNRFAMGR